jgi:hypothetical protein
MDISISRCNVVEIINESQRFLFHIFIVHIIINLIDNKPNEFLNENILKTLLATIIAVIIYNISIKRLIEPKIKKLKNMCTELENNTVIDDIDPLKYEKNGYNK